MTLLAHRRHRVRDVVVLEPLPDPPVILERTTPTAVPDPGEIRDRELLKEIAHRDVDAFGLLFDRYASTAMALAVAIVGRRPQAEDTVHRVFLGVWQDPGVLRSERGTVRSWLLSTVQHRAVALVRSQGMTHTTPVPMDDMPLELWQIVELMYFGGLSQTRIAEFLSLPLPVVKSRTLLAMRLLQSILGGPVR